ncbi:hypothetical protein AVEN_102301-1 [Araneus ventricosus]|uniref:CRAL/TRIO N-terminal domain-containing protein n=1 Tax=Araneus ventricosus TaxID=182803 RepID=A0A4Y2IFS8_ARAVE|nr:hypothetical protein AVEN_102301-1 [Araneus ventricosus]
MDDSRDFSFGEWAVVWGVGKDIMMLTDFSPEEQAVIEELEKRMIDCVTPKMLEDNYLFYRFAKARDFNLAEAETMLRKHVCWRKEFGIDTILTDYKPPELMEIEEDRMFLQCQREPGRPGHLGGVNKKLTDKEEMARLRVVKEENRRIKYVSASKSSASYEPLQEDSSSTSSENIDSKISQH